MTDQNDTPTTDATSVADAATTDAATTDAATTMAADPTAGMADTGVNVADANLRPLTDSELSSVLEAWSGNVDKVKDTDGYQPVFNDTVRTVVYVAALIASVVGLGFMSFGDAAIGGFISTAAGIIAGGFGTAYNPLRKN